MGGIIGLQRGYSVMKRLTFVYSLSSNKEKYPSLLSTDSIFSLKIISSSGIDIDREQLPPRQKRPLLLPTVYIASDTLKLY